MPNRDLNPCCFGYASGGDEYCTCWEPHETTIEPDAPDGEPCHDCAGLPDSPEDKAGLWPSILRQKKPFHCHAGMARVLSVRHAITKEIRQLHGNGTFAPAWSEGIRLRADGRPARLCVCWVRARQQKKEVTNG